MKSCGLLFYTAVICLYPGKSLAQRFKGQRFVVPLDLAQGNATVPIPVSNLEGEDIIVDCVYDVATPLETPPDCISDELACLAYRKPLLYLCRDECQKPLFKNYTDGYYDGKYSIVYMKSSISTTLRVTIKWLTSTDAGLYTCGLRAPWGLHLSSHFNLSVIAIIGPKDKNDDIISIRQPSSIRSATPTVKKPSAVAKVVHAEEGQDITVECPLEYLAFTPPPNECFRGKGVCFLFFQPLLYLQQVQSSTTIITQLDYAEHQRFSLKYGEKFLTVGIANVSDADAGRYICGVEARSGNTSSLMFEIVVTERTESNRQVKLLLLLLIPALLLTAGGLLALMCYKKRKPSRDPQSADSSGNTGVVMYENLPAQRPTDPTYQSLTLDTRDNNQVYSSLDSPQLYDAVC